jgi:type II secretory pathway component PulC
MSKPILFLTLLCGFLLGVIAGPWLWPRDLLRSSPPTEPEPSLAPVAAVAEPEPTPPPPPEPPPAAEPELVLKGVFVGADAGRSRALIAEGDDSPRPYKVNDKLPNGYVLRAVNHKDVEIEKNGESLTLPLARSQSPVEEEGLHEETLPPDADETPEASQPDELPTATEPPTASTQEAGT